MAFPYVVGFINRATGLVEHAPMTRLHTKYSYKVHSLTEYKMVGYSDGSRREQLRLIIQQFKLLLV